MAKAPDARARKAASAFTIDSAKYNRKAVRYTNVEMDPDLQRWVKVMAAANNVTVGCVLNQAIDFAREHSEKVTI